jgi:outer membrane protein
MNTKLIITIQIILATLAIQLQAQQVWDLNTCVKYAIENNIDINIQKNNVIQQKVNLAESKAKLLPDLNVGSSVNFNFGRSIDGATNDIIYEQTVSNNLWVSSSVDLFQGLIKRNTIGFNKFLLLANKQEHEVIRNKLIIKVISAYYIALYSQGLESVAMGQVDLSKMQYERMQVLADIGKESPITVQDLKSQWVADKLNLAKAQNQKNDKILELKQLLRLDAFDNFNIDTSNNKPIIINTLPMVDSVFNRAIQFLPEIKQQEFLLNASKKDVQISIGGMLPNLFLSAGMGSNFFNGDDLSYNAQINNNQNQQIRLGISIPIFNRTSVHSSVKRKKLAVANQLLQIEKNKELVYSEIWNVLHSAASAEKEYQTSLELYKYSSLAFKNTIKKLEKGLASTSDFEIAKQRLVSSEVEMLKSKLTYIMHTQILEYYKTGNWDHLDLNEF